MVGTHGIPWRTTRSNRREFVGHRSARNSGGSGNRSLCARYPSDSFARRPGDGARSAGRSGDSPLRVRTRSSRLFSCTQSRSRRGTLGARPCARSRRRSRNVTVPSRRTHLRPALHTIPGPHHLGADLPDLAAPASSSTHRDLNIKHTVHTVRTSVPTRSTSSILLQPCHSISPLCSLERSSPPRPSEAPMPSSKPENGSVTVRLVGRSASKYRYPIAPITDGSKKHWFASWCISASAPALRCRGVRGCSCRSSLARGCTVFLPRK